MRYALLIIPICISIIIFGCSKSNTPSTPDLPQAQVNDSELVMVDAGTMNLETGETEPQRDMSGYMNVTPYVGSNFSWYIEHDGGELYTVYLNLVNGTSFTVYDVLLVFDNLYGKEGDGDGWVDIYQPYDIDPCVMFNKDIMYRAFPPAAEDEREFDLRWPDGTSPMVDYFIIAHLGGNTGGVYDFDDYHWEGQLYDYGGAANLFATVLDHQNDVSYVVADTRAFTGGLTFLSPTGEPGEWSATIFNTEGAPFGEYDFWLAASSPSTPAYNTYYNGWIRVARNPITMYVDDDNTTGPWDGTLENPYQYVQDAIDNCYHGDTIRVRPGVYYEDPGGNPSSRDAEIKVGYIHDLSIIGEGMPRIVLHDYEYDQYPPDGINASGCENLVIDGFEFTASEQYEHAIYVGSCDNAQIKNCRITPGTSGFYGFMEIQYCDGVIVENNSCDGMVFNNDPDRRIRIVDFSSNDYSTFRLNKITGLTQAEPGVSSTPNYEYELVSIRNCDFAKVNKNKIGNIEWAHSNDYIAYVTVLDVSFGESVIVRNNLIYDVTCTDLLNDGSNNLIGLMIGYNNNSSQIYNNTIDSLLMTSSAGGSKDATGIMVDNSDILPIFVNNIITRIDTPSGGGASGFWADFPIEQTYSDVWYIGHGNGSRYYWEAIEGEGGIDADPQFVDYQHHDYRLQPSSPCVDTGASGYDMGCYGGTDPLP